VLHAGHQCPVKQPFSLHSPSSAESEAAAYRKTNCSEHFLPPKTLDAAEEWPPQANLAPELRVRRNYPYAGKGDGLTSHLRLHFPPRAYVGIELEVNQSIVLAGGRRWTALPQSADRVATVGV